MMKCINIQGLGIIPNLAKLHPKTLRSSLSTHNYGSQCNTSIKLQQNEGKESKEGNS